MDTNIKRLMHGTGGTSKFIVFTHDNAGRDGMPAVIFDPQNQTWSIQTDKPLLPIDFDLVQKAISAMKEQMAGVDAAIASEKHG